MSPCRCAAPANACAPSIVAALAGAGVSEVSVREPRLRVVPVRTDTIIANAAARLIATRRGALRRARRSRPMATLSDALSDESTDAIVAIGGTGSGRNDTSVQTLARAGRLVVHGVALTPGETAAFGFVGTRPVLLLPGRLDAALGVWLTVGRRMLERLAAGDDERAGRDAHARAQSHVYRRPCRSRSGAPFRRHRRAAGGEISAAVRADALGRMDAGAGRQRRLFRRRAGSGKAVAMRIVA